MKEPVVRVLNVNDDLASRYLLTRALTQAGYTVVEATDGETALKLARGAVDLIVLDVQLPGISGLEVCRLLKADPQTAAISIVQTSAAYTSRDRKVEGLDSGADAYLVQPFDPVELLATIRALLRARRAEDESRRAAETWQQTFDAIADAIVVLDADYIVARTNAAACRLFGRSPEELRGRSVEEALGGVVDRELVMALAHLAIDRGNETEIRIGDRFHRLGVAARDDNSDVVLVFSDVTDKKALLDQHRQRADELAAESQRKDDFLAMLAHELRNPLNAIATANALELRNDPTSRPKAVVARQVKNLARLVDDLLDVSRIAHGKVEMRRRPMDLRVAIDHACFGIASTLTARRQQLVKTLPDAPVRLVGDDLRLEQLVSNLLSNAVKYSPPETVIHIALAVEDVAGGRAAVLRVSDQGEGIAEDRLASIFDMFQQGDQTLARSLGGLGIGLSVARRVAEMHEGTLVARSPGVGKGSTFELHLPLGEQEIEVPAAPPSVPAAPSTRGGLAVLVVEDNEDARSLMTELLEGEGHRVRGVSNGNDALDVALADVPDVAFVDIGLPGIDGYEVARVVRANEKTKRVRLVAVTGYGRPADHERAMHAGFDAYIVKPVDEAALVGALRRTPGRPWSRV